MHKLNQSEMGKIAALFDNWMETPIWSCLQGYMGRAWADDALEPKAAQIITGDLCFFAGEPNTQLVRNVPSDFPSRYLLMVPQNQEWASLIECEHKGRYCKTMRYAIKKERDVFNRDRLNTYIQNLSKEFTLRKIDEVLYHSIKKEDWSKDLCSQFPQYQDYKRMGLGYVVLHGESIVSGASSYTAYNGGIEIEIDTREDFRRRGLALVCAARLILECLDKGLYPSWDAANKESVALAEKLGYNFDYEYLTYSIDTGRIVDA